MKKFMVGLFVIAFVQFMNVACFAATGDPVIEGKAASSITVTGTLTAGEVSTTSITGGDLDMNGNRLIQSQSIADLTAGKQGASSLWFDGVDDYVSVGDDADLDMGTGDYSYVIQFILDNVSDDAGFFRRYENGNNECRLRYRQASQTLSGYFYDNSGYIANITSAFTPVAGKNYSVVWAIDNGISNSVFINGELQTLSSDGHAGGLFDIVASMEIGRTSTHFPGQISSTRLFNLALDYDDPTDKAIINGGETPWKYKGASQTNVITTVNDSTFAAWTGNWTLSFGATVADGTGKMKITQTTINTGAKLDLDAQGLGVIAGKRYRITFDAWQGDGTGTTIGVGLGDGASGRLLPENQITYGAVQTTYSVEYTSPGSDQFVYIIGMDTDQNGKYFYIDNISITQIGEVLSLTPEGITPSVWVDKSGNGLNGTIHEAIVVNPQPSLYVGIAGETPKMVVDEDGRVLIGNGTSTAMGIGDGAGGNTAYDVQVTGSSASIGVGRWSPNEVGARLTMTKSRNTTVGGDTIVQDNDIVGDINWIADDGANQTTATAQIRGEIDDSSPAASSIGGALTFSTGAGLAADDITERMRIDSAGAVSIAGDSVTVATAQTPASNAACTTGEIAWDANYIYICTASTVWKRAALTGGY